MMSYDEYFAYATAKGNTPFTPEAVNHFINDALSRGITMGQIEEFLAFNPGDYNRLAEAFNTVSSQQHTTVAIGAGNALQTVAGLSASPFTQSMSMPQRQDSEIVGQYQTSGVVPTNANAGPASVGGYSSNAVGGSTLFGPATTQGGAPVSLALGAGFLGLSWMTWIIIAAMAGAGYYLLTRKG